MRPAQRLGRGLGLALAGLSAAFLLPSCGGEAPEMLAIEWRLELRPSEAGDYESLSVFAAIRDADGIEDLDALWLISDEAELSWSIDSGAWTRRSEGSETWLGASDLALPDRSPLPRGPYRLVAADLAGRRVERHFRLEEPGPRPPAPILRANGGELIVESGWPETLFLAFDLTGSLIKAVQAKPGRVQAAGLLGAQDAARSAAYGLYGYDPTHRSGAYSWRLTK